MAAVDLAQAEKHQRWKHQSATSSVQGAGAAQSVQGDDASAAASSVRSEGVAQRVRWVTIAVPLPQLPRV